MTTEPEDKSSEPHDTDPPPPSRDPASETLPGWVHDVEQTVSDPGEGAFGANDVVSFGASEDTEEGATVSPPPEGRTELSGLLEALIFASDKPVSASELAKSSAAPLPEVRAVLATLKEEYAPRGVQLDEVAGGWLFRTSVIYAPFVRDLSKQKPVKLTRAQVETLAILAYRQPITRPEIDDIRGVDSGPVLKLLLERDLVRMLGKKDEPGRPILYGTTTTFLELFGLKSLRDLPTLREFTELSEDSRRVVERELGDVIDAHQDDTPDVPPAAPAPADLDEVVSVTPPHPFDELNEVGEPENDPLDPE